MAKVIGYIVLSIVLIGGLACLGVLIYGSCVDMSFVEVWQQIFGITKDTAEVAEKTGAVSALFKL